MVSPQTRRCRGTAIVNALGETWVALQTDDDLTIAECTAGAEVKKRVHPVVVRGIRDARPEKLPYNEKNGSK
jgi:hypothetical protein